MCTSWSSVNQISNFKFSAFFSRFVRTLIIKISGSISVSSNSTSIHRVRNGGKLVILFHSSPKNITKRCRSPSWKSAEERGSYENEDLRPPTKTKTITKTKTPYENEDPSRKRKHITKTSSKEVGITFVDKDYVHETHYENEDPYGNLEFWIWHVCNLLRNISTVEPHGAFNGTTLELKRDVSWGVLGLCFRNSGRALRTSEWCRTRRTNFISACADEIPPLLGHCVSHYMSILNIQTVLQRCE